MKIYLFKFLIIFFYVLVLVVNYLANSLPLNNRSTGDISDSYPSLFTPAGFTFSIWGIIYILLGVFVVKAVVIDNNQFLSSYSTTFVILFLATCITNVLWLFCWHYDKIGLSLIIMTIFLAILSIITFYIKDLDHFAKISFSVYTGWISIAFIANITIFLVKQNIPFFQNNEFIWFIIVMLVGVAIGFTVMILTKNLIYVTVFIWAYFGIFMKHYQKYGYYLTKNMNVFNLVLLFCLIIGFVFFLISNDYKMIE